MDRTTGLICDQTIVLTGTHSSHDYPVPLRRVGYRDPEIGQKLDFLTNDLSLDRQRLCVCESPSRTGVFQPELHSRKLAIRNQPSLLDSLPDTTAHDHI